MFIFWKYWSVNQPHNNRWSDAVQTCKVSFKHCLSKNKQWKDADLLWITKPNTTPDERPGMLCIFEFWVWDTEVIILK